MHRKPDLKVWEELPPITHLPIAHASTNLGDDIQTFCAMQRLHCDRFVDRDDPRSWPADAVVPLIGWFGYGDFPSHARGVLIGIHVQEEQREAYSDARVVDWFRSGVREQGFPAMARDLETRDYLRSLGIDAEFGGCVTQTLPPYSGRREGTLIIDVDDPSLEGCRDSHDREHLPALSPMQRLAEAAIQLQRLASSRLVYTSRFARVVALSSRGDRSDLRPCSGAVSAGPLLWASGGLNATRRSASLRGNVG